jgi:hypothetical protein
MPSVPGATMPLCEECLIARTSPPGLIAVSLAQLGGKYSRGIALDAQHVQRQTLLTRCQYWHIVSHVKEIA